MSDTATPAAAAPVNERVAALVNDLIRATSGGATAHLAQRLRDEAARWREAGTTVVVVGEPNRGKSTLVNAIVGEAALPAGATAATGAHVVLRHSDERRFTVLDGDGQEREVDAAELADLVVGDRAAEIDGVTATLPSPALASGLVLVDTPGVGGLSAAHGRITLAALRRADAILFLLDPAEPLSRPELSFLEQASERVERVLFVMTRTDRNPGWATIAEDDARLVAEWAPRFAGAPILPTSARLAMTAAELAAAGDPDEALAEESGVPRLLRRIESDLVNRLAAVRLANLLRLAGGAVAELDRPAHLAAEAAAGPSEAREVVAGLQAELERLRETSERTQIEVTDRFNALREVASADFGRMMRDLSGRFGDGAKAPDTDDLVSTLHTEVRAGCAEITETLDVEVASIVESVEATIGRIDLEVASLDIDSGGLLAEPTTASDAAEPDPMARLRIASAVASGGTGLSMFGRYIGGDPVLAGMVGAGAILAVTMGVLNLRMMRRQRDLTSLRKQVQATLEGARTEVTPVLRQQILVVQREVERAFKSAVRQQTKDLQDRIAEATQLVRSDEAQRQAARTDAERRLAANQPLRQRTAALTTEVAALLG